MNSALITVCTLALTAAAEPAAAGQTRETVIESFDAPSLPANLAQNNSAATLVPAGSGAGRALKVEFKAVDWPNVYFTAPAGTWDWSGYLGLAVDVYNPGLEPVDVCSRVDNEGADGMNACNTGKTSVDPGETQTFRTYFNVNMGKPNRFWGMRGVPGGVVRSAGPSIDPARITAYQVFLPMPQRPATLVLDNIRLFGKGEALDEIVALPFVNRFGQYRHADWPGKLHKERELKEWMRQEEKALAQAPSLPGRDPYGGWMEGPQLEATGWFRTQKVEGKWWLVTPDGHLFFSAGMDCVGTWEQTFVEGRADWFEWLPKPKEKKYQPFYGYAEHAHSMADAIGGKGKTFNFYRANLLRKYGGDWETKWREISLTRLRAWGFNTIGNWSQGDVMDQNKVPFTATIGIGGDFRRIEGGAGYWGKMTDAYDPNFAIAVDADVASVAGRYAANPWCIGYFVDNELSWGSPSSRDIAAWALASPPDQPCRVAFVDRLKQRYPTVADLNRVWGADAADWASLRAPAKPNDACAKDMDEFIYQFSRRYFETIQAALRRHAPRQLYLGCRFAGPPSKPVMRACAEFADIVSFNLYYRAINCADWTGENDLGKPLIIGEFHFGALDRGMFHTGLVETRNQQDRAESYKRYVLSVADCPAFVGCHWFQYVDEPITGRYFDGENYNIGFVTVVDQPYPEMVAKAKETHAELYPRRYAGTK